MTRSERTLFKDWLLTLPDSLAPASLAFLLEIEKGQLHLTPGAAEKLPGLDPAALHSTLPQALGKDSLEGEILRRATIACGPREDSPAAASARRIWALIPIEADNGDMLLVGLFVGPVSGNSVQEQTEALRHTLQDADRRHGVNQPLTALSFLLENLLHAFATGAPDNDYRTRKARDLGLQLVQLRTLLPISMPPLR